MNELEIINKLTKIIGQPSRGYSRIGDDVAYFSPKKGKIVIKSDMLVGRTDIPTGMSFWHAARKSIVMCVSDFSAKGIVPNAVLISLGLKKDTTKKQVQELAEGFKKAKNEFQIEFLGGDTNETDDLIIDCLMIGFGSRIISRKGAKIGDLVVTSGLFGYSSAGLKIMLNRLHVDKVFKNKAISSIILPKPKLKLGVSLGQKKLLSSSIDSSDGLSMSLYEIANQNHVGIEIQKLPVDKEVLMFAKTNKLDFKELVLYGGEEYEIVGTIPKTKINYAQKIARETGENIHIIGKIVDRPSEVYMIKKGKRIKIEKKGWVHLAK